MNSELKKELERLYKVERSGWDKVRNEDFYDLVESDFGEVGRKACYQLKEDRREEYELLQASRGNSFDPNLSVEQNVANMADEVKDLHVVDKMRFRDLSKNMPLEFLEGGPVAAFTTFVEIGFRQPRLMNYAQNVMGLDVLGFDVVNANVLVARELGYDAHTHNMGDASKKLPKFPKRSLVCCYHMLEHISDPRVGLQKIYDAMDETSLLHVEVPCESAWDEVRLPNLDAGHLFNFAPTNLEDFARDIGFVVHNTRYGYDENIGWFEANILSKNKNHYADANEDGLTSKQPITIITKYGRHLENGQRYPSV